MGKSRSQPTRFRKIPGGAGLGLALVAAALLPDLAALVLDAQALVQRVLLLRLVGRGEDLGHRRPRQVAGQQPAHGIDLRLHDAVRPREVAQRQVGGGGDLGHVVVPDEGGSIGGKDIGDGGEVAVADPDAGDQRALVDGRIGIGRQEAEGLQVAEVVGGAGLQGRRPAALIGLELEARAPDRVLGGIGVVGQDVGDQVGGLLRQDALWLGGVLGVVVDDRCRRDR